LVLPLITFIVHASPEDNLFDKSFHCLRVDLCRVAKTLPVAVRIGGRWLDSALVDADADDDGIYDDS